MCSEVVASGVGESLKISFANGVAGEMSRPEMGVFASDAIDVGVNVKMNPVFLDDEAIDGMVEGASG